MHSRHALPNSFVGYRTCPMLSGLLTGNCQSRHLA